jgi:hypothetical protein
MNYDPRREIDEATRAGLISMPGLLEPQGLKPLLHLDLYGTTKVVPFPKSIARLLFLLGTRNSQLRTN